MNRSLCPHGRSLPAAVACALAIGAGVAGCGNEVSEAVGADRFRGELSATVATYDDGTSVETRYLRQPDGSELRLAFTTRDPDDDVSPGDPIEIWGTRASDHIDVLSLRSLLAESDLADRRSALVNAAARPEKRMAFVLVNMGGVATLTQAQAVERLFTDVTAPDTSVAHYYIEESYGIQAVTGDVFSLSYPALTTCTNGDTGALANTLRSMIPGTYDQYGWYFSSNQQSCGFAGLAAIGTAARPAHDTWFNSSSGCVVLVQEPGHNYGMTHSSSIKCGTSTLKDDLSTGCTHDEYGDPFDPMGKGCYHMNMYQKAYQGWLGGCNSVKVTASDTFDIFPMESSCNGIQVLQVPMPKVRPFTRPAGGGAGGGTTNLAYYYIEYRQPFGNFERASGNLYQGVLIHAGEDYRTSAQAARYPYILDMNPGTTTFNDAALTVGNTFTDPAGSVSITLVAATTTKATVRIQITGGTAAAPTCLDGTTIVAPGPQSCAGAGGATAGGGGTPGAGGALDGGAGTGSEPGSSRVPPGQTSTGALSGGCSCDTAGDPAAHPIGGSLPMTFTALAVASLLVRRQSRLRRLRVGALRRTGAASGWPPPTSHH